MSKRVSNKAHGGGARSVRTHRVFVSRTVARRTREQQQRDELLKQRAEAFNRQRSQQRTFKESFASRARRFVRRIVGI